jgi:hypothetical protein
MLDGIVTHLLTIGYVAEIRTDRRARLSFDGSPLGGSLAKVSHRLDVEWKGSTFELEFSSAWALSVSDDDGMALEARVDEACSKAASAIEGRLPPASAPEPAVRVVERQVLVTRCKFCQKITPVDLQACSECGAAKFV